MSKQAVLMVTQLGDQEIQVGRCSHAQARLMAKKNHGRIKNGKLYIQLRPVHVDAAQNSIHTLQKTHDPQVSRAELDRRLEWLKGLVSGVTKCQLAQLESEKSPRVRWSQPSRKSWPSLTTPEQEEWAAEVRDALKSWEEHPNLTPASPEPFTVEGEEVFRQTPGEYDTQELQQMWENCGGVDQKTVEHAYRAYGTSYAPTPQGGLTPKVEAALVEDRPEESEEEVIKHHHRLRDQRRAEMEQGYSNLSVQNDITLTLGGEMTSEALREKWGAEVLADAGWKEQDGWCYWGRHALDLSEAHEEPNEYRVVWTRGQPVD